MARTLRRAGLWAALVVSGAAFLFLAVGPRLLPYRTVTMLTGSMGDTAPGGSVVVDVAEPVSALRPGQVISFHAPVAGRPVVTHRVLTVEHRGGQVLVRTRGDANAAPDPWLARVDDDTVWRMRAAIPHLGAVVRALRGDAVHMTLAWVLPSMLLAWFLLVLWRPAPTSEDGGESACPVSPDGARPFSPPPPPPWPSAPPAPEPRSPRQPVRSSR